MAQDYEPIIPARPAFRADGTLYSEQFDDVYASAHGSLEQARHVFLSGNGLPERWQSAERFVIVETGFGAGLNFLATWRLWKQAAPANAQLHFLSAEKHPFSRTDLHRIHADFPEIAPLARELHDKWPALLPGFHRLHFEGGRLCLTLLLGDASGMLAQLDAAADAFMLDGFAPSRNPRMWDAGVFEQIARLAKPGATCATYSVAAVVREGLSAAGFSVEKQPGFAGKRDMLTGTFTGARTSPPLLSPKRAIIVGAGLAGTSCAERLVSRGWNAGLFEGHSRPAQEASGNPAGLIRPVVSADWNTHSRFTTAGYLYTTRHHRDIAAGGHDLVQGQGGVIQLARDGARFEKQQRLVEGFRLPAGFLRTMQSDEASDLAGAPVSGAGWWFPDAVWAQPASICRANLAAAGAALQVHYGIPIASIERREGEWHVLDADGRSLDHAPVLILANAYQALKFAPAGSLPLRPVRGQVSLIPARPGHRLNIAVCGDGYVTPAIDGRHCVGASFNEGIFDPVERIEDHAGNLGRLQRMLPGFGERLDAASLTGRVAFRTMARDRLPVVGAMEEPGLHACLALGSRGMTWSALAAELVASQVNGDPLPLERDLVTALAPQRFQGKSAGQDGAGQD